MCRLIGYGRGIEMHAEITQEEALAYLDPSKPQFEYDEIDTTTWRGIDQAERMLDEGWTIQSTHLSYVTLQRQKEN